jgi:hypothetical protein
MSVSDLPTLNAILNLTSATLIAAGGYFIYKRKIEAHKKCMIAALFVSMDTDTGGAGRCTGWMAPKASSSS